jgi:hypothetical protein
MQKIEISEKIPNFEFRPAKRFNFFVEFFFLTKFESMKINKVYSFSPLYVGNLILKSFSQNKIMRKLSNSNENTTVVENTHWGFSNFTKNIIKFDKNRNQAWSEITESVINQESWLTLFTLKPYLSVFSESISLSFKWT